MFRIKTQSIQSLTNQLKNPLVILLLISGLIAGGITSNLLSSVTVNKLTTEKQNLEASLTREQTYSSSLYNYTQELNKQLDAKKQENDDQKLELEVIGQEKKSLENNLNEKNEVLKAYATKLIAEQGQTYSLNQTVEDLEEATEHLNQELSQAMETITNQDIIIENFENTDWVTYALELEQELNTKINTNVYLLNQVYSLENEIIDLTENKITVLDISFSRPENTRERLTYWINEANSSIQIMMMLITSDELANSLVEAVDRGINVTIIIDDQYVDSSGSDYEFLLQNGIDIRNDDRSGLMHHKVMIIDGEVLIVGSYNWSVSAEDSNDEDVLFLRSRIITEYYVNEFDRLWEQTSP